MQSWLGILTAGRSKTTSRPGENANEKRGKKTPEALIETNNECERERNERHMNNYPIIMKQLMGVKKEVVYKEKTWRSVGVE